MNSFVSFTMSILVSTNWNFYLMLELPFLTILSLIVFGLGGCIALAIVPWACIGTGLFKEQDYQSGPSE